MTGRARAMRVRVEEALEKTGERKNLDKALSTSNQKRNKTISTIPEWESMRSWARAVKDEVLAGWDYYLDTFSRRAEENGMEVHWADDALEACSIIGGIAERGEAKLIVKSKSMLTEEIGLNNFLEGRGFEVVETDLGEFVAQISGEKPSHIVAPIIHKSREQVIDIYMKRLNAPPLESAEEITAFTRDLLREKFLKADVGITGANFGLAEEGAVVIVENEGNVRLCSTLPRVHVIVMGIERLLPSARELPTFLRLLAVSATGQSITNYVSMIRSARLEDECDGPRELHLVLVDNGRTGINIDPDLREILHCIRCGACLNVCPVYQRIGGHSYGWIYPGPMGSVLTPLLCESHDYQELPYLSTLCGRCSETCPVKIELEHLLIQMRRKMVDRGSGRKLEKFLFLLFSHTAESPTLFRFLERVLRIPLTVLAKKASIPLPDPSPRSFHRRWVGGERDWG